MKAGESVDDVSADDASDPLDIVELREHDPEWARSYERERTELLRTLGSKALCVEHMGSTAIPGIVAKPVIDILLGVEDLSLELYEKALATIGYVHVPIDDPERLFFRKGMPRTHHLHIVLADGEEYRRHIRFRDRLRERPEEAKEYERLKIELAGRYRKDRQAYSDGKDELIQDILSR